MKKMIMTIGIPASGKTTWSKCTERKGEAYHVSRDSIRNNIGLKYGEKEAVVSQMFLRKLLDAFQHNDTVIADATNISKMARVKLMNTLKAYVPNLEIEGLYFDTNVFECIKRNSRRIWDRCDDKEISKMYVDLLRNKPEMNEGFSEITFIRTL